MELLNEFRVPVSIDRAWEVLTDVERIAPCIPGAQLLTVDGDDFTGAVKVKVGPITVQYRGNASFEDRDASAHRAVIRANGKETRGQGNAAAVVTAELKDEGDSTSCVLTTDLTISGKAAQFAERLEADVLAGPTAATNNETSPVPTVSAGTPDDAASVDLLSVVAVPIAKRVAPAAAGLAVGIAIGFLLGRRRS